jgi:hypothetical protein
LHNRYCCLDGCHGASEEMMMIRLETAMVLRIATICGFDPADRQRLPEVLAIAGAPCRVLEALGVAKDDLRRLAARIATGLGRRAGEVAGAGTEVASLGVLRRLAVLGFLAGAAINYWSFCLLGRKASAFYRQLFQGALSCSGEMKWSQAI